MPRDITLLARDMSTLLDERPLRHLHAQAHARAMLVQLGTPEDSWPNFTSTLDERLLRAAHLLLVRGMELSDSIDHSELSRSLLFRGAEALEFITNVAHSSISPLDERLNAAMAYHVAGYHARSYVLIAKIDAALNEQAASDVALPSILALLTRDLRRMSAACLAVLTGSDSDQSVANGLREATLGDDEAIGRLGRRSLVQALLLYLEYVKRGTQTFLASARNLCTQVATLGQQAGHVDLWWLGLAVEKLLRDLGESSLWVGLRDLDPSGLYAGVIERYVQAGLRTTPATITLWPSQRNALKTITAPDSPSFCIRMPTSAGKTKLAELCIIRAILLATESAEAKCLYIAPFRSLAVEVEGTLRKSLRPLGVRVSEIYGGLDLTASDERLIQETQVLVATPEKVDAAIRLMPTLLQGIRLVIVDEGHIAGDVSERGIRAEFLLNRLLWRLGRANCRHVFISAVLPNTQEFAKWIGGDSDNVAESDWRPSRLVFGECDWNRDRGSVRLSFTHQDAQRLEHEVFVQPFIPLKPTRGVPGLGRRRNPFPHNDREAFATCAINFARNGTTLAFIPQSRHVDSAARDILEAMQALRALAEYAGERWSYPTPDPQSVTMKEAIETVVDELGDQSELESFLRAGIAVHRGNLSSRVRIAIERLIRSGEVRLVVATTTLGQGVNLPVRTVLIRGLQQSEGRSVDAMTVWNIAGRAGRAMRENEGQVLFFNDTGRDANRVDRQRRLVSAIIDRTAITDVVGMLHRILSQLSLRWQNDSPALTLVQLCQKLAEDDFEWVAESHRAELHGLFNLVDQHMLAISVEGQLDSGSLDAIQEILRNSLLAVQLEARPLSNIDLEGAGTVLSARVRGIFRRVPQAVRREQFYLLGMSLNDCEVVESLRDDIIELIERSRSWAELEVAGRLSLLLSFVELAGRVDAASNAVSSVPANVLQIVRGWLSGQRCVEMVSDGVASEFDDDPGHLARFLEDYCVYGIAWVIGGFVSFAKREYSDALVLLPPVIEHFPSMVKLGVHDAVASVFVPYLQMDRRLALILAAVCPYDIVDIEAVIRWLHTVDVDEMIGRGITSGDALAIVKNRRSSPEFKFFDLESESVTWTISVASELSAELVEEAAVIIHPRPEEGPSHFDVLKLSGRALGSYYLPRGSLPVWMMDPVYVQASVGRIDQARDGSFNVQVNIRELAR